MPAKKRPYETQTINEKLSSNIKYIVGGVASVVIIAAVVFGLMQLRNTLADQVADRPDYSFDITNSVEEVVRDYDPKYGKEDASVKVVLFEDMLCPHCADYHPTVVRLLNEFDGDVQFVFKTVSYQSADAELGRAALAAAEQGLYKEYSDAVFNNQTDVRLNKNTELRGIAERLEDQGLDFAKWNDDRLNNPDVQYRAQEFNDDDFEAYLLANAPGSNASTPTTVIIKDGQHVDAISGNQSYDVVSALINSTLASSPESDVEDSEGN